MLLGVVLSVYLVLVGQRGFLLVRDGRPAFVLLGVGVLVLPIVGAWILVREVGFGRATERLGAELAASSADPVEELPRLPGGRVDRAAAEDVFDRRRADVQADPGDWRGWFRLALAYDDAGDRPRARAAMRRAIVLHDR